MPTFRSRLIIVPLLSAILLCFSNVAMAVTPSAETCKEVSVTLSCGACTLKPKVWAHVSGEYNGDDNTCVTKSRINKWRHYCELNTRQYIDHQVGITWKYKLGGISYKWAEPEGCSFQSK